MKIKPAILALAIGLSACTFDPRPECMPDNYTMAMLFCEIHLEESMLRLGFIRSKEAIKPFYKETLENFNLNAEQFDSCVNWLSRNRREYEKVYEIVMHRLRSDKAEQNDVERKRAIRLSVWKKFGKEEINTGDFSDLWIRLDSVNKVLPPDFCKRHGGRSPYIE